MDDLKSRLSNLNSKDGIEKFFKQSGTNFDAPMGAWLDLNAPKTPDSKIEALAKQLEEERAARKAYEDQQLQARQEAERSEGAGDGFELHRKARDIWNASYAKAEKLVP